MLISRYFCDQSQYRDRSQPNYQGYSAEKGASNPTNAEGNYICRDAGDRRVGRKAPARIGGQGASDAGQWRDLKKKENQVGVQKPGFLRKYFIPTDKLAKNPVSLVVVRNSRAIVSNGRILWNYQHPRFYFFPGFC